MEQNDKRQAYQDGYRAAVCEFELYSETEIPIDRICIESWKRGRSSSLLLVPEELQPKWLEGYTDATNALTTRAAADKKQAASEEPVSEEPVSEEAVSEEPASEEPRHRLTLQRISESGTPWMTIGNHLIEQHGSAAAAGRELGVSGQVVIGWTAGRKPQSRSVIKVAAVLGFSVEDLLAATGTKVKLPARDDGEVERLSAELEECKEALAEVEDLLEQSIGLMTSALGPNFDHATFNTWAETVEGYLMARSER